ncbi:hypothetical protein DB345_16450 [Spartobacteria bacterium LR76]|nr:hypothetical protein DB345_16450 [Spartobacteria bacterium LR76]
MSEEISRQQFLKLLSAGGASLFGLSAGLFGQENRGPISPWARLKYPGRNGDNDDWNVHPNGDLNLIDAMQDQTTLNFDKRWNVAEVDKLTTLTPFPFLFMHGDVAPELDDTERANLREYLLRGGFLFAEDCVNGKRHHGSLNDEFFKQMAEVEIPKIFPDAKFERLPYDHPVFHCFYHFYSGQPHMQGQQHGLHGVTVNGRLVMLLSPSDTHCGWTNGDRWFGTGKQMEAFKMGCNIYLYAMTQQGSIISDVRKAG